MQKSHHHLKLLNIIMRGTVKYAHILTYSVSIR